MAVRDTAAILPTRVAITSRYSASTFVVSSTALLLSHSSRDAGAHRFSLARSLRGFVEFLHPVAVLQHFAWFRSVRRADDAIFLHYIDQARGAEGLRLNWRERGGPLVTVPKRTGFGHIVMKRMIEQAVQGTVALNFAPEGLQWSLQAPETVLLR